MLHIVSLPKYIDEIRILLAKQDLDILALNETRLDNMLSDDLMSVHNYDLIRTDRKRQGGGVCLYIRSNLNYLKVAPYSFLKFQVIQVTFFSAQIYVKYT